MGEGLRRSAEPPCSDYLRRIEVVLVGGVADLDQECVDIRVEAVPRTGEAHEHANGTARGMVVPTDNSPVGTTWIRGLAELAVNRHAQ